MSAAQIERITADILSRVPNIRSAEDGLDLLQEQIVRFARQAADHAYLKVSSEPGWTSEAAEQFTDTVVMGHLNAIAETVLALGGGSAMACDLAEKSVKAFGERLRELSAAPQAGGLA